jgi:hypothetical protein
MVADHRVRAFGVFLHRKELEAALSELKESGFPMDDVSVIAKQTDEEISLQGADATNQIDDKPIEQASKVTTDAVNNATWATVLVGLTSLSLFGAGPILAAGSLGAALVTGVAGAGVEALAVRDLVNAMTKLGLPEKDAQFYVDRVVQGNYLLMIEENGDRMQQAEVNLAQHGMRTWNVYDAVQG